MEKIADIAEARIKATPFLSEIATALKLSAYAVFFAVVLYVAYSMGSIVYGIVSEPPSAEAAQILPALLFSFLRLVVAYVISLLWTIPVAILIAKSQKAERYLLPVFEVAAAVPAIALFPMIVLVVISLTGSMDIAAVLLVLTGMQWYLLFNLIAGVKSIPAELDDAAASFGIRGKLYREKVLMPAMLPSLITGSVIAFGGGWNALIVSEYVVYGGKTYSAFGIGSILSKAVYETGDGKMIMLALFAMVTFISAMNSLFWRKIYEYATKKYRMD